ncbi:hypothetical protein H5410_003747 [Solanum commersonii]|uniref:F-box associated beta-propeller type 1 domain-containing protein n=1 Tax=Solanum commersonii TaxID=4109 RepID=A0A9J6B5M5_SOLCO|nr:hypothetical protein H5410_003747 [Solanum commersonii]
MTNGTIKKLSEDVEIYIFFKLPMKSITRFKCVTKTIRKYRLLPTSPFVCPRGFYRAIGGVEFGYDAIQMNFKVVRISEISGEEPFNDPSVVDWIGEVYNFSIDSWRELAFGEEEFPWPYNYPFAEMYYKGVFHWYAHRNLVVILCFDSSTEVFRVIQVPEACSLYDEKVHCLAILDECLAFICYLTREG